MSELKTIMCSACGTGAGEGQGDDLQLDTSTGGPDTIAPWPCATRSFVGVGQGERLGRSERNSRLRARRSR